MSEAENGSVHDSNVDAECQNCKRKGHGVILGFKELCNEYAVPFEIWEGLAKCEHNDTLTNSWDYRSRDKTSTLCLQVTVCIFNSIFLLLKSSNP
ncbi:hypothetical protein Peur_055335 [Populus x canadensis]